MQIILTLSKQNKLFGNENKAEDHTQQSIKMKTKLPKSVYKGNYRDSLREFSKRRMMCIRGEGEFTSTGRLVDLIRCLDMFLISLVIKNPVNWVLIS